MSARTTEEERPIGRVFFHRRPQPIHTFAAGDSLLQLGKVKSSVAPRDLPEIDRVFDANIVEGNECLFGDSLADITKSTGDLRRLSASLLLPLRSRHLLATAAASSEGNIALGGFLKAIEVLRQQSCDFDSASDLIGYLEQLEELNETEGCTALPPDANVVRVMNLHKAKGLEAPVVFLTDTSMAFKGKPICHIDRSGDEPAGYMGITAAHGQWVTKDVATPEDWKKFQDEEQRFLDAENDRLLYVATTRAACMTVVSVGKDNSNWNSLHPYLEDAASLQIPTDPQLNKAKSKKKPVSKPKHSFPTPAELSQKWTAACAPIRDRQRQDSGTQRHNTAQLASLRRLRIQTGFGDS